MKYMIPFLSLLACGESVVQHGVLPAPDINGKPSYLVRIPVQDSGSARGLTNYDQQWILETQICQNGFQDTKIEYAPFSDDGISTKNITFYCL